MTTGGLGNNRAHAQVGSAVESVQDQDIILIQKILHKSGAH